MSSFEPIAIVGRACVLPGALDPASLFDAVRDGRVLIDEAADDVDPAIETALARG